MTATKERLESYARRIGVLLHLEPHESGYRILIEDSADLVFDEMVVGYVEEEMGLRLEDDRDPVPGGWRRLGRLAAIGEMPSAVRGTLYWRGADA